MIAPETPVRLPDWRRRLAGYLAEVGRAPFRPGAHDCALFVAGAVRAMTGVDLAAQYRGRYTTLRGGYRVLRKEGVADHIALAAAIFEEVPTAFAQVGDVAVMPSEIDGGALGVVQGEMVYVLQPAGMALVSRMHMERAFRV